VTPGLGSGEGSGRPDSVFLNGLEDMGDKSFVVEGGIDVNCFILRALAAGSKALQDGPKIIVGISNQRRSMLIFIFDRLPIRRQRHTAPCHFPSGIRGASTTAYDRACISRCRWTHICPSAPRACALSVS
jgi:hypothetical protein